MYSMGAMARAAPVLAQAPSAVRRRRNGCVQSAILAAFFNSAIGRGNPYSSQMA
ncbi:hypothetical protein [Mycobacterium antarcticum]|uniref:hypothetical protein n=1 Tax=Mycolicibacterium sp. TUM20985 TaxID=3023370 RepID=UPI00257314EB|nr:hypothetical protein [Mycolicibacterium sp. TUM20985]